MVRIRKVLFLIFFFPHTLINFVTASELGGIKILQSADNFINYDGNPKRQRNYDKNVKIFLNNSFNLSFLAHERYVSEKTKRYNDFLIPKPDFFFDGYYVLERDNYIIQIYSFKELADWLDQSSFKVGECESLREQLIREKLDLTTKEKKYSKQFSRRTINEGFLFKDRTIFEYSYRNNEIVHLLTCYYAIKYDDSAEQHFVNSELLEAVALKEEFNKREKFSYHQNIEKFDSNYIKNFKIWGNINEINYDEGEIFSLENYRLKSFQKHNEIKKQNEIKSKKKIDEENKKYLEQEKLKVQKKPVAIWTEEKLEAQNKAKEEKKINSLFETVSLRAQIMRCWNIPLGLRLAPEDMVVRVKLHLEPDGSIEEIEMLDLEKMNTPGKESFRVLAESVERALLMCKKLNVPPSGYEKWKKIIFKFDASEML